MLWEEMAVVQVGLGEQVVEYRRMYAFVISMLEYSRRMEEMEKLTQQQAQYT